VINFPAFVGIDESSSSMECFSHHVFRVGNLPINAIVRLDAMDGRMIQYSQKWRFKAGIFFMNYIIRRK
jgi:hypothetical protein